MSQEWVDGTYEAGADGGGNEPIEPTDGESPAEGEGDGIEIGLGEGSTFEPEEDPGAPSV